MSMIDWARNEVSLACDHMTAEEREHDYAGVCFQTALKAFELICKESLTGFQVPQVQTILNRLISRKPLTPIEDVPESWIKTRTHPISHVTKATIRKDGKVGMTDREWAITWIEAIKEKYIHGGDESYDDCRRRSIDMAIEALRQPEIVLCKDCIWFHKPDAETKKSCKCNYHGCVTEEDRYCWWGENDA